MKWHFNEESFSKFNWTIEPPDSIEYIYRQRAQQIRDRYDYVVLMFSGGIDSANMMRVFFDNGIIPDEICSVHEYQGNNNKQAFLTGEIFASAMPFVNDNIAIKHHTRFRIVDSAEAQYLSVQSLDSQGLERAMYGFNNVHNLGNLSRFDVRRLVPEYQAVIDGGRSLCLVWAECKPILTWHTLLNKHVVAFGESGFDMICTAEQQDANDPTRIDEMFYTTPDMPQIVAKQCHQLLNRMRDLASYPDIMTPRALTEQGIDSPHAPGFKIEHPLASTITTYRDNQWWTMKPAVINQTIYPGTPPVIYSQGKNIERLIHPRDQWLRDKLPDQSRNFYMTWARYAKRYQQAWGNPSRNQRLGLRKVDLTSYSLE